MPSRADTPKLQSMIAGKRFVYFFTDMLDGSLFHYEEKGEPAFLLSFTVTGSQKVVKEDPKDGPCYATEAPEAMRSDPNKGNIQSSAIGQTTVLCVSPREVETLSQVLRGDNRPLAERLCNDTRIISRVTRRQ